MATKKTDADRIDSFSKSEAIAVKDYMNEVQSMGDELKKKFGEHRGKNMHYTAIAIMAAYIEYSTVQGIVGSITEMAKSIEDNKGTLDIKCRDGQLLAKEREPIDGRAPL